MSQVEPLYIEEVLKDEFWIMSLHEELSQIKRNDVWELAPYSKNMNIISTKWVFKNKLDEHGLVTRNKATLVAKGYNQQEGIDFGETYVSQPTLRREGDAGLTSMSSKGGKCANSPPTFIRGKRWKNRKCVVYEL